jgi:hypothetical protein
MKQVKSKFIAVLALLLFVGQVAASPLLMCVEMSPMGSEPESHAQAALAPAMTHSMEAHGHHPMNEAMSPVSDHSGHGDNSLCELCASCSSATGSYTGSGQTLLSFSNQSAGYDSALINSSRSNPFRPPITA